jgi:hypothetical protein
MDSEVGEVISGLYTSRAIISTGADHACVVMEIMKKQTVMKSEGMV